MKKMDFKELTQKECVENFGGRYVWVPISRTEGYWKYVVEK